ncbi:hypothetical protein V2G26_004208 [Clonostachys chloroleuca]
MRTMGHNVWGLCGWWKYSERLDSQEDAPIPVQDAHLELNLASKSLMVWSALTVYTVSRVPVLVDLVVA